ncbi:MAG: FAD-dependent oxidoreductase [Candidatus Binatia bacterium]
MAERADAAIIGAGVIGCAVARGFGAARRRAVVVVDRGAPGGEASGAAAAGMLAVASSRAWRGRSPTSRAPVAPGGAAGGGAAQRDRPRRRIRHGRRPRPGLHQPRGGAAGAFPWRASASRGFAVDALDGDAVRAGYPDVNAAVRCAALFADDASLHAGRFVEALHAAAVKRGVAFSRRRAAARRSRLPRPRRGARGGRRPPRSRPRVVIAAAWAAPSAPCLRARLPVLPDRGEMLAVRPATLLALPLFWGDGWCRAPTARS